MLREILEGLGKVNYKVFFTSKMKPKEDVIVKASSEKNARKDAWVILVDRVGNSTKVADLYEITKVEKI